MKKYMIATLIAAAVIACSFFGNITGQTTSNVQPSPNVLVDNAVNSAQQTQVALSLTQEALVKQQNEIAAAQTQAARVVMNQSPQAPQQEGDIPATQTAEAQKTAAMAQVLTQAAATQAAQLSQSDPHFRGKGSAGTDFNGAVIYAWGHWSKQIYALTIQLLAPVGSEMFHLELEGKTFKCTITDQYPNRLYCTGPVMRGGPYAVEVYEDKAGGKEIVFREPYVLPAWTATPIPTPTKVKTPKP